MLSGIDAATTEETMKHACGKCFDVRPALGVFRQEQKKLPSVRSPLGVESANAWNMSLTRGRPDDAIIRQQNSSVRCRSGSSPRRASMCAVCPRTLLSSRRAGSGRPYAAANSSGVVGSSSKSLVIRQARGKSGERRGARIPETVVRSSEARFRRGRRGDWRAGDRRSQRLRASSVYRVLSKGGAGGRCG